MGTLPFTAAGASLTPTPRAEAGAGVLRCALWAGRELGGRVPPTGSPPAGSPVARLDSSWGAHLLALLSTGRTSRDTHGASAGMGFVPARLRSGGSRLGPFCSARPSLPRLTPPAMLCQVSSPSGKCAGSFHCLLFIFHKGIPSFG